uniref:Uncharacterized protein n=1 Tax=Noccaea caerulescens TaxID=107243 RepID=A0A1J3DJV4_NOCCA
MMNQSKRENTTKQLFLKETDQRIWEQSVLGDGIKSVNDPGNITKQRQNQTYPKLNIATKFEKHAERRQEDSQKNFYESGCTHFQVLQIPMKCFMLIH